MTTIPNLLGRPMSPARFVPGHALAAPVPDTGDFLGDAMAHPLWDAGIHGAASVTAFIGAFSTEGALSVLLALVGTVSGWQAVRQIAAHVDGATPPVGDV